jgi:hypothetical protein
VAGGAKAVKTQTGAGLHAAQTQTAVTDDPGAEERRGLFRGQIFRQLVHIILWRNEIFSVTTVHGVSRKLRMVAEIFLSSQAKFAGAVSFVDPGYADA